MYSTTALIKSSKFSGKLVGTHQRLDQVARKLLSHYLPRHQYFPSSKEILRFEGSRGPDGLKRKSPDMDDPSHMLEGDGQALMQNILDHRYNLIQALKQKDTVRAAFEAAWMAHMITDGLTPAHHFPLSEVKDELMTDKEAVKIFGEPLKGVMRGRNFLETARNNWLYWGAGGHMSKHIAYEYGVAMLVAALPHKALTPTLNPQDFTDLDLRTTFYHSLQIIQSYKMYDQFRADSWTTDLARKTREILLPEIIKVITLGWYSAAEAAYHPKKSPTSITNNSRRPQSSTKQALPASKHTSTTEIDI